MSTKKKKIPNPSKQQINILEFLFIIIIGTDVTRTCDQLPINDCQTANGVEYCYCTTDLCNDRKVLPSRKKPDTLYDDEDTSEEYESSGYSSIDTINSDETVVESKPVVSTQSSVIRNIESPSSTVTTAVTAKITMTITTTETTEGIIITDANKAFTTSYNNNQSHTIPTTITSESTYNQASTKSNLVKCSMVMVVVQLIMLM